MTNTTNEDNSPDAIEQLYIESPVIGLVEFRKRIHALIVQERIDEATSGLWVVGKQIKKADLAMLEGRISRLHSELTALKDKQELKG